MPEESKKGHDKKKNDPKEQRRPRRQQAAGEKQMDKKVATESKTASKSEEHKTAAKVTVPQKPVYESPPPEFFQNLKRETDEILKITEEENNKYKKKEIQSNWTKYEMPIESYDEIEEQDMGADYEKLIQAPLSIGGHFQFKHEKSWDVNTGPSLYDKYFDINMEELNLALCTIPFHERNSIEESIFSQTDILSINNRTARFSQKYFNDKSYATAETEAQDKILNSLREKETDEKDYISNDIEIKATKEIADNNNETEPNKPENTDFKLINDKNNEINVELKADPTKTDLDNLITKENIVEKLINTSPMTEIANNIKEKVESIKEENTEHKMSEKEPKVTQKVYERPEEVIDDVKNCDLIISNTDNTAKGHEIKYMKAPETIPALNKAADAAQEPKNPVVESPEDLEKWLDDFLEG